MAKASKILEWCIVRLGEDHNWWVDEVSDPIRWDVDGLSTVDPRQVSYLLELVDTLRDYGFDQDVFEAAFLPFRIEKDLGEGRMRLKRVKDSLFESEEKLFALPDSVDEENGPFADLLDHLTRCRVKMLNDLFDFESKLTVDEVEDQIREEQNASFMEGKAIHCFEELISILDYMPEGYESDEDEEREPKEIEDEEDDLPAIDEEEEEALKNDASLKWDEDDEDKDKDEEEGREGEAKGDEDDEDEEEDLDDLDDDDDEDDEDEEDDDSPRKSRGSSRATPAKGGKSAAPAKPAPAKPAPKRGKR